MKKIIISKPDATFRIKDNLMFIDVKLSKELTKKMRKILEDYREEISLI